MHVPWHAAQVVAVPAAACLLVLWTSPAMAQGFRLPDTGQAKCYGAVSPFAQIPCAGTGQDGEYVINPLDYTDNGDGTVTDNNTSLVWQQEDDFDYTWYEASGTYDYTYNPGWRNVCRALRLGGHSDWRLPSRMELVSLVDHAIFYPTIRTGYFPNTKSSTYWSSTVCAGDPGSAWLVSFGYGSLSQGSKGGRTYVRCVRGGLPAADVRDNGDATVTDMRTGLSWQQGEAGAMTWGEALSYCEVLDLAGSADWRLPNAKELLSLSDDTRVNPAIDTTRFPGVLPYFYWSSTTLARDPSLAWGVGFRIGSLGSGLKSRSSSSYVRCVRGGRPPSASDDTAHVRRDTPAAIPVLANDSDPDGDTVVLESASAAAHGVVTVEGDAVRYEPQAGYIGRDSFTYTVGDGRGLRDTGTVTVAVCGTIRPASAGSQDGWVLESAERSGRGGTVNVRSSVVRLGDDGEDRQCRGILSFDTSALPDRAVVVGATLLFRKEGIVGDDPSVTHGALLGDIIRGDFSGSASLQLTDFEAAAGLKGGFAPFAELTEGRYSGNLSDAARAFVNKRGKTQVRLRFAKDDDDDRSADYLLIHSGNAAPDLRPVLEVTYTLP